MLDNFLRTTKLIGEDAMQKLRQSKIAIFGIGGVGGYVVEALARCGVENFVLVDNDVISNTNLNRQIIALHSTIGKTKVEVMKSRILDINPKAKVQAIQKFYLPQNSQEFDLVGCDYVVDAVDTISAKIELVVQCKQLFIPIISSMGTGNKLNPTLFEISDISKTSVCPLAKIMRKELKARNIYNLKVLYSKELPIKQYNLQDDDQEGTAKRSVPASISFVPSVAGLIIASEIVKDLMTAK